MYIKSENDQRGYKTRYTLSNAIGEVSAITDPKGNVTNYTYNNTTKNLTKIKNGSSEVNYSYSGAGNGNRLTAIATGGATYNFVYDQWSNVQSVNIGNTYPLVANTYGAQNGNLLKSTYGNGQSVEYVYDQYDRVVEVKSAQSSSTAAVTTAKYIYNADGQIARLIDKNGGKTAYTYDLSGRVTDYLTPQGNVLYGYDSLDRTGKITTEFNGLKAVTSYGYQSANRPGTTTLPEGRVEHVYDNLQRERVHEVHASEETARHLRRETSYWDVSGNRTTELLKGHANYVGTSGTDRALVDGFTRFVYTYDANGNISQKDVNGSSGYKTITYSYDSKNQLISEIDLYRGTESTYTYDANGNLTSKTKHHILPEGGTELIGAATYGYSDSVWKDRLTSYKGVDITYDAIGNPLTYYDGRTFTWEQGRRLKSSVLANGTQVSYEYNVDGIRTKKQVGNVITTYLVDSAGTIQALKEGNETLLFMYDSIGMCEGFLWYTGTTKNGAYYYLYDGMGSVIGIVASDYTPVVYYDYDVWGKPYETTGTQAATLGKLNPFRYRGYCYDEETGFYYVSSRYYDPEIGRFISADTSDILGVSSSLYDKNLYAYCDNNPVMRKDVTGKCWIYAALGGGVAGGIIGAVSYLAGVAMSGDEFAWSGLASATAIGVVNGAIGGIAGTLVERTAKGIVSIAAGSLAGIYTAMTTEGSTYEKVAAGVKAMATTTVATYLGTKFDTSGLSNSATAFANYATTMVASIPMEIINVTFQQRARIRQQTNNNTNVQSIRKRPANLVNCLGF